KPPTAPRDRTPSSSLNGCPTPGRPSGPTVTNRGTHRLTRTSRRCSPPTGPVVGVPGGLRDRRLRWKSPVGCAPWVHALTGSLGRDRRGRYGTLVRSHRWGELPSMGRSGRRRDHAPLATQSDPLSERSSPPFLHARAPM